MSLINSASPDNCVVDAALHVSYARRIVFGQWTFVSLNMTTVYTQAWEYIRTASKTYRYVGMTEAGARAKAASLVTLYTRSTKVSVWDSTEGDFIHQDAGDIVMADIVVQHEEASMWTVAVTVSETDTRTALSPSLSPTALFSLENNRDYEEGSDD